MTGNFSEELAVVKVGDEKWGYINHQGLIVIEAKYANAYPFTEGLALVQKDRDHCLCIDKAGKEVFRLPAGISCYEAEFKEGLIPY